MNLAYSKPQKPFAWSWSKLKNYRSCPKRHYHVDLTKDYTEADSEQLTWGNQVHKAMELFVRDGKVLPTAMQRHKDWPTRVKAMKDAGCEVVVERQLAVTKDLQACGYFDADVWFRARVDVSILLPGKDKMITIDWKTGGTVKPEFEQLGLSAQAIFSHHPEVDEVAAIYVWFGHDTQTLKSYKRAEMVTLWNDVLPWVQQMETSYKTTTYPPNPSGLCIHHCPVTSCPHHGRGNR